MIQQANKYFTEAWHNYRNSIIFYMRKSFQTCTRFCVRLKQAPTVKHQVEMCMYFGPMYLYGANRNTELSQSLCSQIRSLFAWTKVC